MESSKIKRLYIMPEVWSTVTQSQVFNWIKLVNEKGISTDCISITAKKHKKKDVEKIEKSLLGSFIEIHDFKKLIINDIHLILVLLNHYFKNVYKYEKIIFQTRLTSLSYVYALMKWLPKTKFIFDARGAYTVEREHVNKDLKENTKDKITGYLSKLSEKVMINKADVIFCVSVALKKYYLAKYNLNSNKFFVFPGAADNDLFVYKESLRIKLRNELSLKSNEILIAYSGSLKKKWEIPDKIFSFFRDLRMKDLRFKLLLITPDIDFANKFIRDYGFEDVVFVKKVERHMVNNYLNAADLGLLLREDVVMNNVASPTKFAEYLITGLPVIISKGVHDFAVNIQDTGYGVVVSELDQISSKEYEKLTKSLKIDRTEIASWGLNNLSKTFFIEHYFKIISNI